jgi:hypothetical protein
MRLYFNQITPNIVSKGLANNNVTIVPKIIKNEEPTNSNTYIPWSQECSIKKYNFKANPIKHYRKQYVNKNTNNTATFSNLSLIGNLDKPGSSIVTNNHTPNSDLLNCNLSIYTYLDKSNDCNILTSDKLYDPSLNKMVCTSFNPTSLVIKTASTILSNNYASSHREYLYNKNKTFNQNLPLTTSESSSLLNGTTITECNGETLCRTFNPSNKKFQCQGPVSSSARTYSLKYGCDDSVHCKKTYLNTLYDKKNTPACVGCNTNNSKLRKTRLTVLK